MGAVLEEDEEENKDQVPDMLDMLKKVDEKHKIKTDSRISSGSGFGR